MPVKIIAGLTNNATGVVNSLDLATMKSDFIDHTSLNATGTRTVGVKTHHCFLYKQQIEDLFDLLPGTSILKINFALHIDPTNECNEQYGNSLTVVLEAAEDNATRTARNGINDYVLIPAYANRSGARTEAATVNSGNPCCPSQGG
jgi:hypothetical protein